MLEHVTEHVPKVVGLDCITKNNKYSKIYSSKIYFQKFIFRNLYFQKSRRKVGLGLGYTEKFLKNSLALQCTQGQQKPEVTSPEPEVGGA
jgi:hypothetical protein